LKTKITPVWILKNLEEIIASASIAAMLVICSCNVFARYLLHNAISWSDEVNICLLAWATFVGSAAAYKRNLHYGMDFIMTHMPDKGKFVLRICITAVIGATCAFLAYHSLIFTMKAVKVMPYTRLSYKYIDASAVVGFSSMTIYSVIYLIQSIVAPDKFKSRFHDQDLEELEDQKEAREKK
jgi:TRAP-type C4-dicarboxylate transport system permease small subunit